MTIDNTKHLPDGRRDEPWAVTLAREVVEKVQWTHPEALARVESFEIVGDDHQAFAAQLLHEVKAEWVATDEERKKITKPLNDALRATNALFKPVLGALERVEDALKQKIAGYMAAKQAANVAALQAASEAPTALAAAQSIEAYAPVQAPAGVSVRHVWKFEVTDSDAVPRELCSPDPKKIGALVPGTEVPGVRWFQDQVVTARSR